MPGKKNTGSSKWVDPDDAPELTKEFFERGEIRHGNKIIRRGRPPLDNPKQAVKLRLEPMGAPPTARRGAADRRAAMRI